MNPIKIGLVDDHQLFRLGINELLSKNPVFKIILNACDGQDFIEKLDPNNLPDIVIMDIKMPRMDGISATRWVKNHFPSIKVLVLSMFEDAEKVLTMVRFGAKGYLLKDCDTEEITDAINKISKGEIYYPEFVTRHLVHNLNEDYSLAKLNVKEIEFLKLSATELTYKEIAEHMRITPRAADAYRDQLFEKLQIKSRIGLVLFAIKNRLIEV